jgi:hypothetical protein
MHMTQTINEKIDELLTFLPLFESKEFEPVKEWNLSGIPHPTYDDRVRFFFLLLAREPWPECEAGAERWHELLAGSNSFETASLDQVSCLLAYCYRMERFCYGFWEIILRKGKITALLRRLDELRDE